MGFFDADDGCAGFEGVGVDMAALCGGGVVSTAHVTDVDVNGVSELEVARTVLSRAAERRSNTLARANITVPCIPWHFGITTTRLSEISSERKAGCIETSLIMLHIQAATG